MSPYPSYRYSAFLPAFDDVKFEPPTPFIHVDPAARALQLEHGGEGQLKYLSGTQITTISPAIGDEVIGVDLTSLDSSARDQLALHAARRGVLVFRGQEAFLGKDAEWFKNWGNHFGRREI